VSRSFKALPEARAWRARMLAGHADVVAGARSAPVLDALARTLRGASFREGRLLFGDETPADVQPLQGAYH